MKGIRVGICALLTFAVLAHGAVEPWSESILEIGVALLFLAWAVLFAAGIAPSLRWNWLLAPLAGFWTYAVAQYVVRITSVSFLTRVEILKLSALMLLFFLAVQGYETLEQWQSFFWFLLSLAFLVSVLGILQHFTFNGKLYWFRELRYGGIPFGPFVNRNHFAGFIELIVPSGLSVLMLRAERRDRLPLVALLTLLPIGALFLAASRGGIMGFILGAGLVLILTSLRGRSRNQVMAGAVVVVLAGGLIAWLGAGQALDRFESYRKLEVSEGRRAEMFKDSWRIFLDRPLLGTGIGTLQEVFPRYESLYDGNVVNHAHNDYVEALAETGIVGGLAGVAFLLLFFKLSWARLTDAKNNMDFALHAGAFAACCALLVHSLVDFNLHIPSNALLFLLQTALATSSTPTMHPFSSGTSRKHSVKSRVAF